MNPIRRAKIRTKSRRRGLRSFLKWRIVFGSRVHVAIYPKPEACS